jgi:hypothetical protein
MARNMNKKMKKNYYSKPQQKTNHRLQQATDYYHPGDHLKEGTYMFILSSVQQV